MNNEVVFTKHARERIKLRNMTESMVIQTINDADNIYKDSDGGIKFIRKINGRKVHVVCRVTEEKKWLVKSAWVRGEDNYGNPVQYHRSHDAKLVKALYIVIIFILVLVFLIILGYIATQL